MIQRYDYTLKQIDNGWMVMLIAMHDDSQENRYFSNRNDAAEYIIKLLGELIDDKS